MPAENQPKRAPSTRPARRRSAPRAPRRILLTGATGFVGQEILRHLLAAGWEVVALAQRHRPEATTPGVIQVAADVTGEGWQRWCEGCAAAINLVGIIRELPRQGVTFDRLHRVATERVVGACRTLGIPRLIHMSALGARPAASTAYFRTKAAAEEVVRASGLTWTIFRPAPIFGPGDGLTTTLARVVRLAPVFPVFGDGRYAIQPIAVGEVASAFVAALHLPASENQVFDLGGPESLPYNEVVRRIAAALGVRRHLLHLPLGLSRLLVRLVERFPGAPITSDQLTMLLEGATCDTGAAALVFDVPRTRFEGPTWLRG